MPEFLSVSKRMHDPKRVIHVRVDPRMKAQLIRLARIRKTEPAKIIRAFLWFGLRKEGFDAPRMKGDYWNPEWMKEA